MHIKITYSILLVILLLPLYGLDAEKCLHLLNRTSFGVNKEQLAICMQHEKYENAVTALVNRSKISVSGNMIECTQNTIRPPAKFRDLNSTQRKAFSTKRRNSYMMLKKLWFEKMLKSENPFFEKMVLFWHNHFTSSLLKVRQASLLCRQNQLFRKYALGNFGALLHEIIEDPAMIIYLDNRANKKSHPNENLARELLELFSLGEGNYQESDIRELARGLTGYSVNKKFDFFYNKKVHDTGIKHFLEHEGVFDAHDMINIILAQEETAVFVVEKLWLAFIGFVPDDKEVKRLAHIFRENNYELKPLMKAIFTSSYFTSPEVRGTMIKSPVELVIGTLRSFEYADFDSTLGVRYLIRLGQNLFDPPNVKGWSGGKNWINTNTLLIRKGFLKRLTRGDAMNDLNLDLFIPTASTQSREERTVQTLLPLKVSITPEANFNNTLQNILQHPLYQLK